MDHQNKPEQSGEEGWLDSVLPPQQFSEEIGPDETAVYAAGLIHPNDAELERIVEETKDEMAAEGYPDSGEINPAAFYDDAFIGQVPGPDAAYPAEDYTGEANPEEAYPEDEYYEEEEAPVRKRRPGRRPGYGFFGIPHLLVTLVWLAIIVAIGVSLGRIAWICAADMLAFGREDKTVVFEVTTDDTLDTVAENLKEAGLIRYPSIFKFFVGLKNAEDEISPGTFTLNTLYDYNALVNSMSPYAEGRETISLTIPEGYTCAQIFALLEEKNVCSTAELEAYSIDGELDEYWFLADVERGSKYCLEGFLFPDTYEFYTNDTPRHVLEKLLDGFDYRFTDKMKENMVLVQEKLDTLLRNNGYDEAYIASHHFTVRDFITVASMVEKETAGGSDSNKIASVIYNRLTNPEFPYLNIDATIVYALGGKTDPLTLDDLQIDSPYNTYTEPGLPAGPIANPGRHSIYAALEPYADEAYYTYYYYAFDPEEGVHHYSTTLEEHEQFLDTIDSYD